MPPRLSMPTPALSSLPTINPAASAHGRPTIAADALRDVYTIPFLDGFLVYFPHRQLVIGVERGVRDLVEQLKRGEPAPQGELADRWIDALQKLADCRAREAPEPTDEFKPGYVTLSLTKRCTLRCIYCYARAGESRQDLPVETARAALEFAANNAAAKPNSTFRVAFHGEGEPTHAWGLFQNCVLHAEELAAARNLPIEFAMSTNGVWSETQCRFVARHFKRLSISLDGLADIQNRQRPFANGAGSFDRIVRNLRRLDEAGVGYGIRATVLPDGVDRMGEFLEFVGTETRADTFAVEPVFESGRGRELRIDREEFYTRFSEAYRRLFPRAAALNVDVAYSGCRPTLTTGHFCQATGSELNFVVMTSGLVSSCYEINDPASDKGEFFVYGRFDAAAGAFVFDEEKLRRLRRHGVRSIPGCRECFAQWNCGGDCLARCDFTLAGLAQSSDRTGTARCKLNRTLTAEALGVYSAAADVLRHDFV